MILVRFHFDWNYCNYNVSKLTLISIIYCCDLTRNSPTQTIPCSTYIKAPISYEKKISIKLSETAGGRLNGFYLSSGILLVRRRKETSCSGAWDIQVSVFVSVYFQKRGQEVCKK